VPGARRRTDQHPHPALEVGAGGGAQVVVAVGHEGAVAGLGAQQHLDHPIRRRIQLGEQLWGQLGQTGRDLWAERLHSNTSR